MAAGDSPTYDGTFYTRLQRNATLYQPDYSRVRHRYRGHRETEKVNLEIGQIYAELSRLCNSITEAEDELEAHVDDILNGVSYNEEIAYDLSITAFTPITDIEQWCTDRSAEMVFYAEGTTFQQERTPWTEDDEITGTYHWADETNNGHDADPQVDTVGNRPLYKDGVTSDVYSNSKPVIWFFPDGRAAGNNESQGLVTDVTASVASPYTTLAVGRLQTYEGFGVFSDGANSNNQAAIAWPSSENPNDNNIHTDSGPGANAKDDIVAEAYFGPVSAAVVWDSTRKIYINGQSVPGAASGRDNYDFTGLTIGARQDAGGAEATRNGWIGFYAVIPGELSAADIAAFADWAKRYGCPYWRGRGEMIPHRRSVDTPVTSPQSVNWRTSAPEEGSLMIATLCSAFNNAHTLHSVTDGGGGSSWTKADGINIGVLGSVSVWYRLAGPSQTTNVSVSVGAAGAFSVELRAVSGVSDTVVQTRAETGGGAALQATCEFESPVTSDNYLFSGFWNQGEPGDPASVDTGPQDWGGNWHGGTDQAYMMTGSQFALSDDKASGTLKWSTSNGWAYVLVEFEKIPGDEVIINSLDVHNRDIMQLEQRIKRLENE
jgi:hypothetical protein